MKNAVLEEKNYNYYETRKAYLIKRSIADVIVANEASNKYILSTGLAID